MVKEKKDVKHQDKMIIDKIFSIYSIEKLKLKEKSFPNIQYENYI